MFSSLCSHKVLNLFLIKDLFGFIIAIFVNKGFYIHPS